MLDKRVGTTPGSLRGATIPEYFRKRILRQQRLAEEIRNREQQENDEQVVVVDDEDCESISSEESTNSVEETEEESADSSEETNEQEDKVEHVKQVEIPDATNLSVLNQETKEYSSIHEKLQAIIAMLQLKAEELERSNDIASIKVEKEETNATADKDCPAKPEQSEADADLESLKKYYENSDEEEPNGEAESSKEHDSDVELVEEAESKPEIIFVDTNALDDDSNDEKLSGIDSKENIVPTKSLKEISKTDLFDPTFSTIKLEPIVAKTSVVDSLFSRFNLSLPTTVPKTAPPTSSAVDPEEGTSSGYVRDRRKIAVKPRYIEEDEKPKKVRPSKIFDKIQLDLDLENGNSNSSTEFYGFDEGEAIKLDKPSVPGLLPTPIVKKCRPNAPFLAPGTIAEDIKIENRDDLFREEGLISFGSLPPRLECPRRPDDMVRPRTVAQKRILLQKKNDVRYLMIDNESKIFNELEKRGKNIDVELDQDRMEELQDQNIPFTRDTWKALAWLKTEKGKYFFQTLRVDNHYVKLTGCRGNHPSKRMGKKQQSAPAHITKKHICHCPEYPANLKVDLSLIQPSDEVEFKDEPEDPIDVENEQEKKLLHDSSQLPIRTRPGPLSSKLRYDSELLNRTEDGAYLGPLELFEMPRVEIEVFPRIDRPLDPTVKPYLKMMLPFQGITEKWARFAVSTLKTPDRKEEDIPAEDRSFSFTMPYLNNQRRILVRRRVKQSSAPKRSAESRERFEKELKQQLEFRKHLDDPELTDEVDPVEKECADILSELTDAVAISLGGDVFISDDPDCDYTKEDKPVERSVVLQDATKNVENAAKSKRMLREMKRLNATIIETVPEPKASPAEDSKTRCDDRYCSRGCICDVFTVKHASIAHAHCSKIDCIFGCQCGYDKRRTTTKDVHADLSEEGLSTLTSEDVKYLREKATAKLAKEERDFTPTVIMTTNSTVLVRNTETEMRRNKKKPKKYDDYYNENSVKSLMNGAIPDEEVPREPSVERTRTSSVIGNQPLSLQDRIRHTHVVLNKLQDLENVEPWCMIHCLYRCYCHGNATNGKPFKFNEESDIVLPAPAVVPPPDPLLQVYEPRRRRLYSFEKTETIPEVRKEPFRKRDSSEESYKPWSERRKKKRKTLEDPLPKSPDKRTSSESAPPSSRPSIEDLQINDGETCRRAIPVNKNFYRTRNYYRKGRYLKEIEEMKQKNPHAEKRLKVLLETCERAFFEERKQELEAQARRAIKRRDRQRQISEGTLDDKQRKEPVKEPIFFDIVGTDAKIQQNLLLSPLIDMSKTLIYCGKKKYYVESDAIETGKVNLMNIARKFRRTVCILKRVENDSRAKPITFSYKNETIMLKGRKYRMNEPYEQQPNEHVDFDCESDDQESTTSLIQQTENEDDAKKVMLQKVNSDIMHTMQHIREMMRKNTSRLNPPKKGILYLFRWEMFLKAFNEDTVDVWDISFQNGSELVILTTENNRKNTPTFKNTRSVRFARKCTFETRGVSLLTKMILHQIDNPETNKLSLVLFGTENYWRFCGFIKAEDNFVDKGCEVRPTPVSHPRLAPKINRYFEAFVASRKKREETIEKPPVDTVETEPSKVVEVPKPIKEEKPTEIPPEPVDISTAMTMVKSNVRLMETKIKDFKNIAIPNVGMRRWFMLNVANDFSDVYIPSWKSCLTYGRIRQAIQLANRYKKTVRLTSIAMKADQEDVLPQIYAAPMQGECIFLGPYSYTQNMDLILCQNVDGKMFTREEYERNNHIVRTDHTTGSWLYMKPNVTSTTTTTTLISEPGPVVPSVASTSPPAMAVSRPDPVVEPIGTQVSSTPTDTMSTANEDCVVIEDDEETIKSSTHDTARPVETQKQPLPESPNNANNQLESLIHQLYNDSDSDDDTPSETSSVVSKSTTSTVITTNSSEQLQTKAASTTNPLSLLVEKTIAESKQIQIKPPPAVNKSAIPVRRMSYVQAPTFATPAVPAEKKQLQIPQRRLSYIPAATTTIAAPNLGFAKPANQPHASGNLKRKSTGSSKIEEKSPDGEQSAKKNRLSLPTQASPAVEEVVCLDDEDDRNEVTPSTPKAKPPSCTTVLNSQQAALIASKINLMDPNQKGVVYNPTTGVLRIKRSLMNSLAEGTNVIVPPSSSAKSVSNSALGNRAPSVSPQMGSTTTATPTATKTAPYSVITPAATPTQLIDKSAAGSELRIEPPKQPTDGVLRSNIPGMGMVPVRWSPTDIIIKVRELSVKHQFVRLANFEAAVVLLNRFIRKNTYTFKPFSLTIGWKFEGRSSMLAPESQLINTINLRCVVTTDGVIDLYKASAIIAFQNVKPNFYEELLLLRLSILCCKKEQYEQEQCHKYFENIFVKATNTIKELTSASEALATQSEFLREQHRERTSYLVKLKGQQGVSPQQLPKIQMVSKRVAVPQSILNSVAKGPTTTPRTTAVPTTSPIQAVNQPKESVIVLDDD